jgi:hypothetical protein
MNRCSITPRHTIIFDSFVSNGMNGYESTIYNDYDKVEYTYRSFLSIDTYKPRRYDNVCRKIHLPLLMRGEIEKRSDSQGSDPYPAPEAGPILLPTLPPNPYP